METKELRIGKATNVADLGASISHSILENPEVSHTLCCIGADSVNQATKGVIKANSLLVSSGKLLHILPTFDKREDDSGSSISVMILVLKLQQL